LRIWPGEGWWAVALINYFAFWFLLSVLPIIILALVFRQKYLFLVSTLAGLLLSIRIIPMVFHSTPTPTPMLTFKVMTFNIYKHNTDLEGIISVIKEADPDILALQELTPTISDGLLRELKESYPYNTLNSDLPVEGQGLLSKYEMMDVSDLPDYRFLSATIQSPQGQLRVFNIHAPKIAPFQWRKGWEEQRDFIEGLLQQTINLSTPVLILGDFNTTTLSKSYAQITEEFRDSFTGTGAGLGFTYPAREKMGIKLPWPLVRIDYIFLNKYVISHETKVILENGGSDHRPVCWSMVCRNVLDWERQTVGIIVAYKSSMSKCEFGDE
jgi:vancomycin resistance protein VanJ